MRGIGIALVLLAGCQYYANEPGAPKPLPAYAGSAYKCSVCGIVVDPQAPHTHAGPPVRPPTGTPWASPPPC